MGFINWEQNHKAPGIYINNDYASFTKSIKMTSSSKQNKQKPQNTKNQFSKRIVRNRDLHKTVQNNDHALITHKIQFRSPFKLMCQSDEAERYTSRFSLHLLKKSLMENIFCAVFLIFIALPRPSEMVR